MIRYLAAALALLVAAPAAAADTCATPADAKVSTSTDTAALNKGVACRTARIKGRQDTIVGLQAANKVDADQVAARVARLEQLAKPAPAPAAAKLAGLVAEGDSITLKWGGNYVGLWEARHPGTKVTSLAVAGARISDTGSGNGLLQRLPALLAAKPAVVSILIGANDLGDGQYPSLDAWLAALWSVTAQVRATGAKVAVGTVLPICYTEANLADYVARHAQRRPIVNAAIRAAVGSKIDAVFDVADALGGDRAPCTDRKLWKDGIHPSDSNGKDGGQDRVYAIYAPVVDKLLGAATAGTQPSAPAAPPTAPVPSTGVIPSNFDTTAFISRGIPIPPSAAPDVVGAFRFICQAGQLLKDDPIVWPGQPGKAHALHQFFGNLSADGNSTFASLRTAGDSSCMNPLNRSAYWMPAMLNGAGQVIRPDFISIYYKRRPASDPECKRMASGGCVGLPNGLKLISGFDHDVIGPQPARNLTFHWRCVATSQTHRDNLTDALADCGGEGQLIGSVFFGSCWNGEIDSADHRSHVVPFIRDPNSGKELCPKGYDRIIPELTQSMAWTVTKADGAVQLSSDMGAKPGSTLHADYMTAWDDPTLATAMRNCIDKLLNCSDGDLGNGTIMKRWAGFGYTANPRVVPAPAGTVMTGMVR